MAGETVKTEAICLRIRPWSRTSQIVVWLTPRGVVGTVVKGALRPKSFFLGQFDLNYTCEIVYYSRARGELHALRECLPLESRDGLRRNWRWLAMADYYRALAEKFAPSGPDAEEWYRLLEDSLAEPVADEAHLLDFEIKALSLMGLSPAIEAESGGFSLRGERRMPVSPAVAACLGNPLAEVSRTVLLDSVRAVGVFYTFHVDQGLDARRTVLTMISYPKENQTR